MFNPNPVVSMVCRIEDGTSSGISKVSGGKPTKKPASSWCLNTHIDAGSYSSLKPYKPAGTLKKITK